MKKEIPFTKEYQDLVLDMDFEYFQNEYLKEQKATPEEIAIIKEAYNTTKKDIEKRYKKNKKQCRLWLGGIWHGGLLPAQLRLNGTTQSFIIIDFEQTGENWAYFDYWQKLEKRRRFWRVTWNGVTKVGAILAIALTVLKLIDVSFPEQ